MRAGIECMHQSVQASQFAGLVIPLTRARACWWRWMMSLVKVPQEVRQARSVAAKKKKGAAWLAELHAPSATALHAPAALRAHSAQGRTCIHMRRRAHCKLFVWRGKYACGGQGLSSHDFLLSFDSGKASQRSQRAQEALVSLHDFFKQGLLSSRLFRPEQRN